MKKPNATSLILFGFSLGLFVSANAATLGSSAFPDVPGGAYFDSAVGDMYAAGIITGYESGKFGPNDYVTRGQVAVMMQRLKAHLTGQTIRVSSSSSSRSTQSTSSSSSSSDSSVAEPTDEGSFRFTTGSYKVNEDEGSVTINLVRYGGNTGVVTVEYATEDGTANSGDDYDAESGRVTFGDGKTTATFTVTVHDDNEVEGNEMIILKLSDPTGGAQLGSPILATLTIVDNDEGDGSEENVSNPKGVFEFSTTKYEVLESGDSIEITVERIGTSGAATVKYQTSDGTADGSLYDSESGTLSFADGVSEQSFTIDVSDNSGTNGNKTVNLKLSAPTGGATLGSLSTATLVIVDDEVSDFGNGEITIDEDEYEISEGDTVKVLVKRLRGADGEVSVEYETQNALAKSGSDYTEKTGTLTFRKGETEKYISVPTTDDNANDPRETFWVKIFNPTGGATLGDVTQTTITIQ